MNKNYFEYVSLELLLKLKQVKEFITKHNHTIGVLTEEILKNFLSTYLPKSISVEQGFIKSTKGALSKQCDIILYDNQNFAPLYRINDIVIVPEESVIAVVEVKTLVNRQIFNSALEFFKCLLPICPAARTFLFIYTSTTHNDIERFLSSYKFDHDTFQELPDEIIGIENSFLVEKGYVITDSDNIGYNFYHFVDKENNEITALQNFFISLYNQILKHNSKDKSKNIDLSNYYERDLIGLTGTKLFST